MFKDIVKSPSSGKNEHVIILGSYSKEAYADQTAKELVNYGFKVNSKKIINGFTRIGVYVYCADKEELDARLKEFKKKYPNDIWVLSDENK